jgi:hypothetical protein
MPQGGSRAKDIEGWKRRFRADLLAVRERTIAHKKEIAAQGAERGQRKLSGTVSTPA